MLVQHNAKVSPETENGNAIEIAASMEREDILPLLRFTFVNESNTSVKSTFFTPSKK